MPCHRVLPLLALLVLPGDVAAQGPPRAVASRITTAPVLDGRLDEAFWRDGAPLGPLSQREPREGLPVSERTEVRIFYDSQALYVGAWLFDASGEPPVPGQSLRDASLTDADAFQLVLDPFLDRQSGFIFGTTPAGIEYDAQVTNEGGDGGGRSGGRQQAGSGGGFNLNWDGNWQVATSRDAQGWYVEMRIPFATLRYRQGGPQAWGLNVERRMRRKNEQAVWAPLPRQFDITRLSLAGTLELEAPVRRIISASPYVVGSTFRDYRVASPATDFSTEVGVDAKLGISQGLTLDVTVNTDFAQAEVDDQQVNLTRFSLFLPEKRGFFLENAGLFAVGASRAAELFFSRRIGLSEGREVPILGGARLTGRLAGLQVGALSIQTRDLAIPTGVPGQVEQVAPDNNFGVLRAYRELGSRSYLGAILVSRVNTGDSDDHNLAYGVDGRLGLGQDLTFDGWLGLTSSPLTPAVAAGRAGLFNEGEYALGLGGRYITRNWQVTSSYRQVGDHFNPEVGFANRLGYRYASARVLRHLRMPHVAWFREFRPHVSWNQYWSLDGFTESYLLHVDTHFAFENGAFFQLPGFNITGEGLQEPFEIRPGIVIPAGTYHNAEWEFRANTNQGAPLSVSGGWELGGFFSGHRFGPTATVTYRGRGPLSGSLQASWFDVRLAEGNFTTAVARVNTVYTFSPRLYLLGNFQYNADTRDVSANLRFGWVGSAGTGLFVVYNDTQHVGPLERTGLSAGPKQRQLVVKVSRLFDFSR